MKTPSCSTCWKRELARTSAARSESFRGRTSSRMPGAHRERLMLASPSALSGTFKTSSWRFCAFLASAPAVAYTVLRRALCM